jgi:hypothetical protein
MAVDFVEKSNTKTSVRTLPVPFVDTTAFNTVVTNVIENNPLECISYEAGGETIAAVVRGREQYTARIVYVDADGKRIGAASVTSGTIAGMNAAATALMADAALTAAVGGTPIRDAGKDTYSCALKCHDENGETYTLTFTRKTVRLSSYQDDLIRDTVEDWADTVSALC